MGSERLGQYPSSLSLSASCVCSQCTPAARQTNFSPNLQCHQSNDGKGKNCHRGHKYDPLRHYEERLLSAEYNFLKRGVSRFSLLQHRKKMKVCAISVSNSNCACSLCVQFIVSGWKMQSTALYRYLYSSLPAT